MLRARILLERARRRRACCGVPANELVLSGPLRPAIVRLAAPDFDCDVIVALEFVRDPDVGEIPEIREAWAVSDRVRAGGLVIITSSGVTTET